jgi:maleylacetate reductase
LSGQLLSRRLATADSRDTQGFDIVMPRQRVVFAVGAVERIPQVVEALGSSRLLLISSGSAKSTADDLARDLGAVVASRVHEVVQHVPETLADSASTLARDTGADGIVSLGGGSATGLGKAVAVATGLPLVAVPTTYAGSEMTAAYGVTGEHKVTGRDERALPHAVVYDPALTTTMPAGTTAASGLNAVAHCVEAVYAPRRSPLTTLAAEAGVRALAAALPRAVDEPDDVSARSSAMYGAFLAGWVMNIAGTSLHHTLCHVVGGTYRVSHAGVHAVLLPHVVAFVEPAVGDALQPIAAALAAPSAGAGIARLARDLRAPSSLAEIGMPETGLDESAERAVAAVGDRSPRPIDLDTIRRLLADAHAGRPPGSFEAHGSA